MENLERNSEKWVTVETKLVNRCPSETHNTKQFISENALDTHKLFSALKITNKGGSSNQKPVR